MADDTPSNQTTSDWLHAIARAAISAVPVVGSPVAELFGFLVVAPASKRRDEWMRSLEERVIELENKIPGLIKALPSNNEFITATLHATQVAMRSHQTEKLAALRNAVINVAAGSAPDEDLQSIFLNLIDSFTALHLRLLKQFSLQMLVPISDAPCWLKTGACSQAAKELLDRGLLGTPSHLVPNRDRLMSGENGVYRFHAQLTQLGNQFLSFITSPPALGE